MGTWLRPPFACGECAWVYKRLFKGQPLHHMIRMCLSFRDTFNNLPFSRERVNRVDHLSLNS